MNIFLMALGLFPIKELITSMKASKTLRAMVFIGLAIFVGLVLFLVHMATKS